MSGPVLPPGGAGLTGAGVPPVRESGRVRGPVPAGEGEHPRSEGAADGPRGARGDRVARGDRLAGAGADGTGLAQVARLEQVLPARLLERAEWLRTEWAWRRLMFDLTGIPGPAQAPADPSDGGGGANPEAMVRLWTVLAELAQGASDGEVYWPGARVEGHPPVDPPPGGGFSAAPNSAGSPSAASSDLASAPNPTRAGGGSVAPGAGQTGAVVDFAHWGHSQYAHAPETVQRKALAARVQAAVQAPDGAVLGAGLFWPGPAGAQPTRGPAVHWEGRRRSRTTPDGRTVHRLELRVPVRGGDVAVEILAAQPSVSVRLAAPQALRPALAAAEAAVGAALAASGWRLSGWHVSDEEGDDDGAAAGGGAPV